MSLGTLGSSFNYDFSEAPNGSVYYSSGSTVFVVHGTSKPVAVLHASGQVFAVAANRTELFVDVGRKVTGYKLSNGVAGVALRHWTLYTTNKTTSAGLYVAGSTRLGVDGLGHRRERIRVRRREQIQDLVRDGAQGQQQRLPGGHGR